MKAGIRKRETPFWPAGGERRAGGRAEAGAGAQAEAGERGVGKARPFTDGYSP